MRLIDLFSGIGGFSLAASWCWGDELEIVTFCEMDKFCQRVLHKHWPNTPIVEDVNDVERIVENTKSLGRRPWRAKPTGQFRGIGTHGTDSAIDLLTGGFPCQPASCAGKRKGTSDDRWLWPAMFEVIRATSPRWIVAENVPGLLSLEGGGGIRACVP